MRIRCCNQLILVVWLAARGGRNSNVERMGARFVLLRTNGNSAGEALCLP